MTTPSDLQNSVGSIQWTNGRGLIAGSTLLGLFTLIIGVLAGMGTWSSTGYTPNIAANTIAAAQLQSGAAATNVGAISGDCSGALPILTCATLGGRTVSMVGFSGNASDLTNLGPAVTTALGYTPAHSGANADITVMSGLTTPLSVGQGGTGAAAAAAARSALGAAASGANTDILSLGGLTAGVSCSGAPTASFAAVGGIVTHC